MQSLSFFLLIWRLDFDLVGLVLSWLCDATGNKCQLFTGSVAGIRSFFLLDFIRCLLNVVGTLAAVFVVIIIVVVVVVVVEGKSFTLRFLEMAAILPLLDNDDLAQIFGIIFGWRNCLHFIDGVQGCWMGFAQTCLCADRLLMLWVWFRNCCDVDVEGWITNNFFWIRIARRSITICSSQFLIQQISRQCTVCLVHHQSCHWIRQDQIHVSGTSCSLTKELFSHLFEAFSIVFCGFYNVRCAHKSGKIASLQLYWRQWRNIRRGFVVSLLDLNCLLQGRRLVR